MKTVVVRLDYVALPLGLQLGRSGVAVWGLDIDPAEIETVNVGDAFR